MAKTTKTERRKLFGLDARYRLLIASLVTIGAWFFVKNHYTIAELALTLWIIFALIIIVLDWIIILAFHPRELRDMARLQDTSQTFLFLFIIAASVASLVAITFLLKSSKGHHDTVTAHILLSMAAVIVSWWLVHTIFTLRYARLYYETAIKEGAAIVRGLIFPHDHEPDYLDFVYFSFIIGMTFQVSDVNVSSRTIRRLAWMHGLISFAFNTVIVALSINVISGLISG
jgi:uncharacterized membrane protein